MADEEQQTSNLTEQEAETILRNLAETKETSHSFYTKVINAPDSTKIGNLSKEELGTSNNPVRTYKELALFCNELCEDHEFGDFFTAMAEIQLATSLSEEGFLLKQAGTSRKEIADMTPKRKVNKSWFKKKNQDGGGDNQ